MSTQTLDSPQACERIVRDFIESWPQRDPARLTRHFAPDAVYHNVPVAPIKGVDAIRQTFASFLAAFPSVRFEVISLATAPGLVIVERVDHFTPAGGSTFSLPVTGVFVVAGGKIVRFSDYFDLADWERKSGIRL